MDGKPDIFVSYSREDHVTARRFAEAFVSQGFSVWWDATLRSGEAYDEVTEKALREARAVVVLWSKKSVVSRWVRAEATVADRNKTLVPAMIEACERPIMFELTQTAELGHWTGAADDKAWIAFLSDVRRFVEKDAAPLSAGPVVASEPPPHGERGEAPSLAVLPFTNRSGLPEDEVFAIGMAEDVIEALSQGANVRVVASSATARFRTGAIPDLDAMGRQLGVRYLLEGNVRRAGANLRVTAQLVEAANGTVLWTQKFERPLSELATLQEDLVVEVAANLDVQVYRIEMERALRKPADLTAWEAVTRAMASYGQLTRENVERSIDEARHAIAIAPDYGLAHAVLALSTARRYYFFSLDDADEVRRIKGHIGTALALESANALVLAFVAHALCLIGQPEEGLLRAERAAAMNAGGGWGHFTSGVACSLLGRSDEALAHLATYRRRSPGTYFSHQMIAVQAWALVNAGRWSEAMTTVEQALAANPDYTVALTLKAIVCHRMGRTGEARDAMTRARQLEPQTPFAIFEMRTRRQQYRGPRVEEVLDDLRKVWAATEPGA